MRIKIKKIEKSIKQDKKDNVNIEFEKTHSENLSKYSFKRKKDCFTAIILKQSKDAIVCYIPNNLSIFFIDKHAYYNVAGGKYLNTDNIICVYLEGCVLPIEHRYIQYENIYSLYHDENGNPVKDLNEIPKDDVDKLLQNENGEYVKNKNGFYAVDKLERIKGIEFDSKTTDVLFEGNMTDRLAQEKYGKMLPLLTVFNFIIILLLISNIIITYYLCS